MTHRLVHNESPTSLHVRREGDHSGETFELLEVRRCRPTAASVGFRETVLTFADGTEIGYVRRPHENEYPGMLREEDLQPGRVIGLRTKGGFVVLWPKSFFDDNYEIVKLDTE